ncbi:MAG: hypothetical protein NZ928_04330 [Endomicrobia bacterium]|nr:hypothetical protein [Endomicrobiia bacterium]MDW8056267.1 hypothetical protein [Elusimicrobiota bacterium]
MKIKNFKVNIRLKEVYSALKNKDIKITPEIETLISVVEREVSEVLTPAVIFDTFEVKDKSVEKILGVISPQKNTQFISLIATTLGLDVDKFIFSTTDIMKINIAEIIVQEYLSSAVLFVIKVIQERLDENLQPSSAFLIPEQLYEDITNILQTEKINIKYLKEENKLLPASSCLNYVYWFKSKK